MIWCRFNDEGTARHGIVDGETVHLADGAPFDDAAPTGVTVPVSGLELLPPVVPTTFFCVGHNYRGHIEHMRAQGRSVEMPTRPEVGYRAQNALVGHGGEIVRPADLTGPLEAEPELVAVIGRTLRRCSYEEAREGVLGWTVGNDVSARAWQASDRTLWRAKNADTFKPMGPWLVTDVDVTEATTTLRVNRRTVASFPTWGMIFDPYEYIVATTRYITMVPGDVLWMGADDTAPMEVGDTVEVTITGLGTLRNQVVVEPADATLRDAYQPTSMELK